MSKRLCKLITSLVIGTMTLVTSAGITTMASSGPSNSGDSSYKTPYTWSRAKTVAGGGFIPAVIYNEGEEGLVYTRTDMGGAYRLDKETKTWIPLTDWVSYDDWNYLGIESLATDPVETNRVYLAAGTYTNDWAGKGAILRSKDKGDTWEKTELPFKLGGNMPGRSMGERLAIDPNADNVLYLGTHNQGLWKSEDYGETWNKVEGFTAEGNYIDPNFDDQTGVVWVTFDKTSAKEGEGSQDIYVGVADTNESIYRSTDGGKTWSPVEGQPTKTTQSSWTEGYLPHHGTLASNGELYITYSNTCGPYDGSKGAVWKYNTKTDKWTDISPVSSSENKFGYGGLAVDAQNPDNLVVSCLNLWWPDVNMYRSTDGGKTWTPFWKNAMWPERDLAYNQDISKAPWLDFGGGQEKPVPNVKLGWMVGGISINPFNSDEMVYGTGATMYGTDNLTNMDKGEKIDITVKADGIEEESVSTVLSPSKGTAHLISGMGDVCGFVHEDLTKTPEKMMVNPNNNTTSMDFAENEQELMVRVGNVMDTDRSTKKSCAFSKDGGKTWTPAANDVAGISGDAGGTVAISADGKTTVWAPGGNGTKMPHYTTDNGATWTASTGLPQNTVIKVTADRVNESKFYAFAKGGFYVSEDSGATFTKTAATGLPSTEASRIKAIKDKEGDIWLAAGNSWEITKGMWHSTDSGKTFTKIEDVEEADSVGFGKAKQGSAYDAIYTNAKINGVRGIFRSDDEGKSWIRINDDDHQYGCAKADISGDPRVYGRVYLATNGLGVVYGEPKEKEVLLGDVNGDGKITQSDYLILRKYLRDKTTVINKENSDVNGDGIISAKDLSALKKLI